MFIDSTGDRDINEAMTDNSPVIPEAVILISSSQNAGGSQEAPNTLHVNDHQEDTLGCDLKKICCMLPCKRETMLRKVLGFKEDDPRGYNVDKLINRIVRGVDKGMFCLYGSVTNYSSGHFFCTAVENGTQRCALGVEDDCFPGEYLAFFVVIFILNCFFIGRMIWKIVGWIYKEVKKVSCGIEPRKTFNVIRCVLFVYLFVILGWNLYFVGKMCSSLDLMRKNLD